MKPGGNSISILGPKEQTKQPTSLLSSTVTILRLPDCVLGGGSISGRDYGFIPLPNAYQVSHKMCSRFEECRLLGCDAVWLL
jgi:hypothetical protein